MHQILPYHIWVGHAGDGRAFRELFDHGVRAIVQLAIEEPPLQPPREFTFLRFPLLDGQGNDLQLLAFAIKSVQSLIEQTTPTLVCCGAGMSRSPLITAAALSVSGGGTIEDCLKQVVAFHFSDISPGLWDDVCRVLAERIPSK